MPGGRRRVRRAPGGAAYAWRTKTFVQPSLLLMLREGEGHGYALMERLKSVGLADDSLNPSVVYQGLREMEEWDWVNSWWDTEGTGPPRRVYRITARGEKFLGEWTRELEEMRSTLDRFLQVFGSADESDGD
ncbi:MAG: PadR family transcriptional regulator [Anaerolineae bacterium]|nr:PadR family transcriptional regulator [Anaerolineae bacterium]